MMHRSSFRALALLTVVVASLYGCATPAPQTSDTSASSVSQTHRFRDAASSAVKSPRVWIPLAGAALLQINNWDHKVSNWAIENTPVFGSHQNASDWSDRLVAISTVSYFVSVIAMPDPKDSDARPWEKARNLAVGIGAMAVTGAVTATLKATTDRMRPTEDSTTSFPSGHSSQSAVSAGLASANLRDMDLSVGARRGLTVGLDAVTIGTAWARVEAGAHFPADTLGGMALGYFVSGFFNDAFLHGASDKRTAWTLVPLRGGLELQWQLAF